MSMVVIMNPAAGSAEEGAELREVLEPMGEITLYLTKQRDDARRMAAQAAQDGATCVVAAGGDGTINEVLNGLMSVEQRPQLGVIPLGTGNDLARTLALPTEPLAAFELVQHGHARQLDVIRIGTPAKQHYALNVAAGGFSGTVDEVLSEELKATWGPLAYLRGAVEALPDLTNYRTVITYDDGAPEVLDALNVIIANGRTAAGGIQVAPAANPEDGLLDVVIVGYAPITALLGAAARLLLTNNYLNSDVVSLRRARQVKITAEPGIWFNADGELLTNEPMEFTVLPQALAVVVGPDYSAAGVPAEPLEPKESNND